MAYFGVDKDVRVKELVLAFQNQIRGRVCHAQRLDHAIQNAPNHYQSFAQTQTKCSAFDHPEKDKLYTNYHTDSTCRTLKSIFSSIDKDGSGALSKAEFEAGLAAFGVFPKTQDLSAMVKYFDKNGDGVIQYEEFCGILREEMSVRKTILVKKVWAKLSKGGDSIDLATVENPAFLHTVGRDSGSMGMQEFKEFYQDLAMQAPSDDYFAQHIDQWWNVHEDVEDKLTFEENMRLLALIRQRLITLANGSQEAYALRKIYMQYDSTLKRGLTLVDMAGIVAKLGVDVEEKGLRGLFSLIDLNRNGVIEFDELSYFIIDDQYK